MLTRLSSFCAQAGDDFGSHTTAMYTMYIGKVKIRLDLAYAAFGGLDWNVIRVIQLIEDFKTTGYHWLRWDRQFFPVSINIRRMGDVRETLDARWATLTAHSVLRPSEIDIRTRDGHSLLTNFAEDDTIVARDAVAAIRTCIQALYFQGTLPTGDAEMTCREGEAVFRIEIKSSIQRSPTVSAMEIHEFTDTLQQYVGNRRRGQWRGFHSHLRLHRNLVQIDVHLSMGIVRFGRGLTTDSNNVTEVM